MKQLNLSCYGIIIEYVEGDIGGASITTQLKETGSNASELFNSAVDGLESIILAHFCAGIDVSSPAYLEGIETAYQAIGNNIDTQDQDVTPFKLTDDCNTEEGDITGYIDNSLNLGIALNFSGYSDYCSNDDNGTPIYIQAHNNELKVIIYGDINQEDPTHSISIEGARTGKRVDNNTEQVAARAYHYD
jgi:hypothetical protein